MSYFLTIKDDNVYLRNGRNIVQTIRVSGAEEAIIQGDLALVYTDENIFHYEIRNNRMILVRTQRL